MKGKFWQSFFKGVFLNLTFLLLILNSSTIHSGGGDKMEDDHDSAASSSASGSGGSSMVSNTKWGEGSYLNPGGGDRSSASGSTVGSHRTPTHKDTAVSL